MNTSTKKLKGLKDYLIKFIKSQNMLVLSTCNNNIPRASSMDYYSDGIIIYVYPGQGQKITNLKNNPVVSISIFAPFDNKNVQGVQISSSNIQFIKKGDIGFEKAQSIYKWKNKEILLKIIPEKIELIDYSLLDKGYSHKQIWDTKYEK